MNALPNITRQLKVELKVDNVHALPRIERVVVNVGVGKHRDDKAYLEAVKKDIAAITGQQPHERTARQAVAGFNVRRGSLVGYRVTLRGKKMADFVQRFVNATLPRVRDFRGIPISSLDGQGNLSVGLSEQLAFPEIHPEQTDVVFGVQVTFVTTAGNDRIARVLFSQLGFPLTEATSATEDLKILTAADRAERERQKGQGALGQPPVAKA